MSAIEIGSVRASASFDAAAFVTGANKTRSQLRALGGTFEKTSRDALRSMEAIERGWDAGVSKAKSSAKDHTLAVLGLVQANSRGSASAREWAAELNRNAQSFDNLRASLDPVFAASKRYEAVVEQVEIAVQSGVTSQSTANRVLDQAAQKYLGLGNVAEQAAAAQKKIAAETAAATQSYQRLRASIDPAYAATKQYEAAVETLSAAQKAGVISDRERSETLALLKQNMAAVGASSVGAQQGVSKFGLVANQVGYQIQDVFVSGPMIGWFRAVAQQAPQAAGAFSMLGGSIGTIVPWLGTALAVGAALAPVLLDLGDASLTLEERSKLNATALDNLVGALDDYSRYAEGARAKTVDLVKEFGIFASDVKSTYEYLSGVSVKRALDGLRTENFDLFANLTDAANVIAQMDDALTALERNKALGATSEQIQVFKENFEGLEDEAYAAAQAIGLMPEEIRAIKSGFDTLRGAQTMKEIQSEAKAALDVIRGFYPEGQKLPAALADAVVQLEAVITASSRALADTEEATVQTQNWAASLSGVNSEIQAIIASLASIGGGLLANAAKQAEIDALKAGKSIRDAAIEAQRFKKEMEFDARREGATWFERLKIDAEQYQFEHGLALDAVLDKEREAARARERNLKKVAAASGKSIKQLKKEAAAVRAGLSPVARYNQELAELARLKGLLSDSEMAQAIRNLNVELADSLPLVGDLADSFTDGLFNGFKGTLDDMGDMFKRWLKEMIATGLRNQIVLRLGLGGGAGVGGAAQAAGTLLGGETGSFFGLGGGLMNIGTTLFGGGAAASGIMSGLGGIFTGGGLGASFANLGGLVSGASAGFGAIGAALPALGIIAGGIAILAKGLSREHHGRAVRGTLGPDGFDGFEFDFYQGGFLRGDKSVRHDTREEIQTMLDSATTGIVNNIETMAGALNLGAEAIKDFEWEGEQFTVWLTGRNAGDQEATAKEFEKHLNTLANGMTDLVLKTEEYTREGESSYDTLTRLGGSLMAANDGFDLLSQTLFEGSLEAANSASLLMDAFGSVEQFASGVGSFFELMFTDVEKQAKRQQYAQDALDAAAADLNLTLPTTHAEFRALIGGLDRTTEEGREAYVTLIGLADEFTVVHGTAQEAADAIGEVSGALNSALAQAEQTYRQVMFTAEVQNAMDIAQASSALNKAFQQLGIAVPQTHAEFVDLVEGLDRTTKGGKETYAALLQVADEFGVVHGTAEDAARALAAESDAQRDAVKSAFSSLTASIDRAVSRMTEKLARIRGRLDLRMERLEVSVEAERLKITNVHERLLETLSDRLGALEAAAETSRDLFETLDAAARARRRIEPEGAEWERRRALMYVQNGGSDPDKLSDALSVLGKDNSAGFSSYADFLTDYYRTSNVIADRSGNAKAEMSADEAAVAALERQISQAEEQQQQEMQRLDQILEEAQKTYQIAIGEYVTAISVDKAVAMLNQTADRHALVSERVETRLEELETIRSNMEQLVSQALGNGETLVGIKAGVVGVQNAVQVLNGSIGSLASGMAANAAAQREANRIAQIKALERTQTISNQQAGRSAAGAQAVSKDDTTAREVREMRKELVGYLGPISKATGATDRSLKRVVRDGLTTKGAA